MSEWVVPLLTNGKWKGRDYILTRHVVRRKTLSIDAKSREVSNDARIGQKDVKLTKIHCDEDS